MQLRLRTDAVRDRQCPRTSWRAVRPCRTNPLPPTSRLRTTVASRARVERARAAAFGDRVRLLREVLLPSPSYMLGAYGLRGKPLGTWLLPALYVHRNVRGAWKILTGKK